MLVLAIDPGTKTGWALVENGKVIESGMEEFTLKRGESAGMRFLKFRVWLGKVMADTKPLNFVVFEQAHHRGGAATEVGVGMSTRVMELASERGIEYQSCHSMTLKKWATGSGKASKEEMMFTANEKTGVKIIDDNHADAILLALWGCQEVGGHESV